MIRLVTIKLEQCSEKCPFFYKGEGRGYCNDWCDCEKEKKRIHEYRNDYNGKFPNFCTLPLDADSK